MISAHNVNIAQASEKPINDKDRDAAYINSDGDAVRH
jgi:hypothetical protein